MEQSTAKKRDTARRIVNKLIDMLADKPLAYWSAVAAWNMAKIEKALLELDNIAIRGTGKYLGIHKTAPQHPDDGGDEAEPE